MRKIFLMLVCFGCTPTGPSPDEHTSTILKEWNIAVEMITPVLPRASKVEWYHFNWRSRDTTFWDCKVWFEEEWYPSNGCLDPNSNTIYWNTQTPGVIQHEAAHAILWKLGHPCYSYVSLNSGVMTFHTYRDRSEFCERWVNEKW